MLIINTYNKYYKLDIKKIFDDSSLSFLRFNLFYILKYIIGFVVGTGDLGSTENLNIPGGAFCLMCTNNSV